MGHTTRTVVTVISSLISRSNRIKKIRSINQKNDENRNLLDVGKVSSDAIIPDHNPLQNMVITGGTQQTRNELIIQNCRQSQHLGVPTLVIHEGNSELEATLIHEFSHFPFFRAINPSNPLYDPVAQLSDNELSRLLYEAASYNLTPDPTGVLYLQIVAKLLRRRGIVPYVRMISTCPFHSLQTLILNAEQKGMITDVEANALRNDLSACSTSRASMELFLSQLISESSILAWKNNVNQCTSIQMCVQSHGILSMDITSSAKKTQLSLLSAEIKSCISMNIPFRVIVDATVLTNNKEFLDLLQKSSRAFSWTLSTQDMSGMVCARHEDLKQWISLCQKVVLFSHGLPTAELLSSELGEYDRCEVTQSHSGSNGIGQFGLHFGASDSVSTLIKRDRVIKPEEIMKLNSDEFILVDNLHKVLKKGFIY